jgi:hypothetical protein
MKQFYSQMGQDRFVVEVLKGLRNGLFLDIGGGEPTFINNTYFLEKELNWTGTSIELDPQCKEKWDNSDRKTTFLLQDALTVDYKTLIPELLKKNGKERIDYLSVDLEPPILTLELLRVLPFDLCRYSVITYEHDYYRPDPGHNEDQAYTLRESRNIFDSNGYGLVFANQQEDWWVDKKFFSSNQYLDINVKPI